jgi:hypothetical protein
VFAVSGYHFAHYSGSIITFVDGRTFQFPVYGNRPTASVMAGVDGSGNAVILFRRAADGWLKRARLWPNPIGMEVTINPDWRVTDHLVLVIAVASRFLDGYSKLLGAASRLR